MQFPELKYNFSYKVISLSSQVSIAYIDLAEKRNDHVLLFIHGLSSYIPAWQKLIPVLKKHYRCIAIDLPGYGKSSPSNHDGKMSYYADTIYRFVKALDLGKVNLVGHSMGGQIAITTALIYPEIVDKLILVAPAGFETFANDEIIWIKKLNSPQYYAALSDEQIRLNYKINFFSMPDDIEFMIQDRINIKGWANYASYCGIVYNSLNSMIDSPVFQDLNKIKNKTLVFFGKDDKLIPHRVLHPFFTAEHIALSGTKEIQNSKLVLIDKCGHFIQYEKPERINNEILNFIS